MKNLKLFLVIIFFFSSWTEVRANDAIIWTGDFETGDFMQWHNLSKSNPQPNYSQMPTYGRPAPYGDGSLLEIVANPVRQGRYAAKFTVKNSINGKEPDDCDVPFPTCTQRRTELTGQGTQPLVYDAMPYMSERWMSISIFIPADWDPKGSGFGPNFWDIKPLHDGASSCFSIQASGNSWRIYHRWSDVADPTWADVPWQQQMYYGANYPVHGKAPLWDDGVKDFVDPKLSQAALGNLNKGGWTDWIIHVKYDARGSKDGGTGFLKFWKRENNNNWIPILDIRPGVISRGGMTFDRGVGYNSPPRKGKSIYGFPDNGGFGIKAGMYMAKEQVWGLSANRVVYLDNIKIGSEKATFAMMTPEYSGGTTPNPTPTPTPTGCHKLTPSSAIPPNYGSPYNLVINSQELLIKANCQSSGAQLNIGNNSPNQFIWSKAYIWRNNGWQVINLSGSTPAYNNLWFKGSANASVSLTSQEMSQENKIVAFVCNWFPDLNKWKCGCRDSACGQMFWQLQNFGNY
jgi:hypothetical protein